MKDMKRNLVAAVLIGAAGALAPGVQAVAAEPGSGAFKLEGAWVAKVQGMPMQWSYVLSPDPSGRKATLHGAIDVGLVVFGPEVTSTALLGEVVVTGPDTAKFNSVWYGRVATPGDFSHMIVYIGMNRGTVKSMGPGKTMVTSRIAFYHPTTDADGDGYPDPGSEPMAPPMEFTSIDTRLPAP